MGLTDENRLTDWAVNIDRSSSSGAFPYIDLARTADYSVTTTGGSRTLAYCITNGLMDATGNTIAPQPETEKVTGLDIAYWFSSNDPREIGTSTYWSDDKKFEVRWVGTGTFSIIGDPSNWSFTDGNDQPISVPYTATNGVVRMDKTTNGLGGERVVFSGISETDPVRNVKILHFPHVADYDAGEECPPAYRDMVKNFSVFRMMDNLGINNSAVVDFSDMKPDGFVSTKQDATNNLYKDAIDTYSAARLCTRFGAHMWICLPHLATDACVRSIIEAADGLLTPELVLYLEYSNELWNSGFSQGGQISGLPALDVVPGGTPYAGWVSGTNNYNGFRACQMLAIAKQYAPNREIRLIVSGHSAVSGRLDEALNTGVQFYIDNVDPGSSINDHVYAGAITTYFMANEVQPGINVVSVSKTNPAVVCSYTDIPFETGDEILIDRHQNQGPDMVELWDDQDPNYVGPYYKITKINDGSFQLDGVDATTWTEWNSLLSLSAGNVSVTSGSDIITITGVDNTLTTATNRWLQFHTTHTIGGITINAGDCFRALSKIGSSPNITMTFQASQTATSSASSTIPMQIGSWFGRMSAHHADMFRIQDESAERYNNGLEPSEYDYMSRIIYQHFNADLQIPHWTTTQMRAQLLPQWQANADVCSAANIKFVIYEGACSHLVAYPQDQRGVARYVDIVNEFSFSGQAASIIADLDQEFRAMGGEMNNRFQEVRKATIFGPWGMFRELGDSNPIADRLIKMAKPPETPQGIRFK